MSRTDQESTGNTRLGLQLSALLLLLVTHAFFLNQYPRFVNPNITSRVYTTLAIVDDGTLAIDGPIKRYGDTQDKALYQGRFYSDKAPGLSIALVPIAWVLRHTMIPRYDLASMITALRLVGLALPILYCWWCAFPYFTRLIQSERLAMAVVLSGALGTSFFIYATELFSASAAGALLFASFLTWRPEAGTPPQGPAHDWQRPLAAGALAGLAFTTDFVVMLAVAVLGIDALLRSRKRPVPGLLFCTGVAVLLTAWMTHNWICFDHPLTVGFHLHVDPKYGELYRQGILGIHAPSFEALFGLLLSPARGLFFLCPALLLAFPGWLRLRGVEEHRSEAWLSFAVFLAIFSFASTAVEWQGGWSVGARYLVPSIPFLLVGVAGVLRDRPAEHPIFLGFAVLSAVGIVGVGLAAASFSSFPYEFRNPIYHFAMPLLREGFHTRSLLLPDGLQPWVPRLYGFILLCAVLLSARLTLGSRPRALVLAAATPLLILPILLLGWSLQEPTETRRIRSRVLDRTAFMMGFDAEVQERSNARKSSPPGQRSGSLPVGPQGRTRSN